MMTALQGPAWVVDMVKDISSRYCTLSTLWGTSSFVFQKYYNIMAADNSSYLPFLKVHPR